MLWLNVYALKAPGPDRTYSPDLELKVAAGCYRLLRDRARGQRWSRQGVGGRWGTEVSAIGGRYSCYSQELNNSLVNVGPRPEETPEAPGGSSPLDAG